MDPRPEPRKPRAWAPPVMADEGKWDSPEAASDAGAEAAGAGDGALDTRARLVRVESLVRRTPVRCPASTSIRDAAGLMARERISSVLARCLDRRVREAFRVIERAQRALAGARPTPR